MDPLVIAVADTSFMELLLLSPGLTTGAFLLVGCCFSNGGAGFCCCWKVFTATLQGTQRIFQSLQQIRCCGDELGVRCSVDNFSDTFTNVRPMDLIFGESASAQTCCMGRPRAGCVLCVHFQPFKIIFQTSCTIVSQPCYTASSVKEIIYDITQIQISVHDCPSDRQDAHQVS